MAVTTHSVLRAGRTDTGCCLKIDGRGTMQESATAQRFAISTLEGGVDMLTIDLSNCTYLDSTFLGCLVALHRQYDRGASPRFFVAAQDAKVHELLHATHLDKLLKIVPTAPACIGDCVTLPVAPADTIAFSQHVMECHRRLAEVEGPHQAKFAKIAECMARELRNLPAVH